MPDRTLSPEDLRAWQLAHEQQPGGYPAAHSIGPHTPSPIKEAEYGTTDFFRGIGSFGARHNIPFLRGFDNPQRAKDVAERLTFASEFVPGYGDILGAAEGGYLAEENPILGTGIVGLSMLPIVGDIAGRTARKKLTTTPTIAHRTVTGYNTPDSPLGAQMSRTNYETNAERSILANYSNPNKAYNVEGLINNTVGSAPEVLRGTLRRQLNEWISPELRRGSATVQEILDDIGRNKPRIQEQVSQDIRGGAPGQYGASPESWSRTEYLPNIPYPTNAPDTAHGAARTLIPLRYTERNLSTHVPGEPPLHSRAGHEEVGQGDIAETHGYEQGFLPMSSRSTPEENAMFQRLQPEGVFGPLSQWNNQNRLFNQRSGLYEIGGRKVFIAAEGQSGVYGMGTSRKQAGESLAPPPPEVMSVFASSPAVRSAVDRGALSWGPDGGTTRDVEWAIGRHLDAGQDFSQFADDIAPYLRSGYSKDEWIDLAARQQQELETTSQKILDAHNVTKEQYQEFIEAHPTSQSLTAADHAADRPYESTLRVVRREMDHAKSDNASKYEPLFTRMIGGRTVEPPFFDEWFPLHMKTALNDAVEQGADTVRFPINDYAIARQTGQPLSPYRAREFREEYTPDPDVDEQWVSPIFDEFSPNRESQALATHYQKRTDNGLRRIEAEYGVELNPRRVRDDNNNVFLEIDLTPDLKEAFKVVIFNRGGEVRAPLMPLKYRV